MLGIIQYKHHQESLVSLTSSSVRNGLPSNAFGRSKGVALLFSQIPCKSGWPSAVLVGVHRPADAVGGAFLAVVGVCAAA